MTLSKDYFYPLSPRLGTLLCTIFTRGGKEELKLLELLPDDDAYALEDKATGLLELDGEARARVIAEEMRKLFEFRDLTRLEAIDPSWLLAALRGEQPYIMGILLAQVSPSVRRSILEGLPDEVARMIPEPETFARLPKEVMRIVRQVFETAFVPMPAPPIHPGHFYFKDITLLESSDIIHMLRALGIDELAAAFIPIGKRKLLELSARLDRKSATELIHAMQETEERDTPTLQNAHEFLTRVLAHLEPQDARSKIRFEKELFLRAGLFRLARALPKERPSFVQALAQRIPRAHGRILKSNVLRIAKQELDDVRIRRIQDLILYRLEKLAAKGQVHPRFLKFVFCYWGDEAPAES